MSFRTLVLGIVLLVMLSPAALAVQYINTQGSNLSIGSAPLFIDNTNDRVGIGTSTPATTLDVTGVVFASSYIRGNELQVSAVRVNENGMYDTAEGAGMYGFGATQAGGAKPLTFSSGDGTTYNDGYIAFSVDGAEVLRMDDSGYVGINTTTPSTMLDVNGSMIISGTDGYLNFGSTAGTSGYGFRASSGVMEFKDSGGSWAPLNTLDDFAIGASVTSGTAGSVLFIGSGSVLAQDNANFFWDDSSNELGIGTNNPLSTLDVRGDVRLGTTNRIGYDANSFYKPSSTDGIIASRGNLTFQIDSDNAGSGDALLFKTGAITAGGGSTLLGIDTSGNIVAPGTIKIGGAGSASHELHVVGDVNVTGTVYYGAQQSQSPIFERTSDPFVARCTTASNGDFVVGYIVSYDDGTFEQVYEKVDPSNPTWYHAECWQKRLQFEEADIENKVRRQTNQPRVVAHDVDVGYELTPQQRVQQEFIRPSSAKGVTGAPVGGADNAELAALRAENARLRALLDEQSASAPVATVEVSTDGRIMTNGQSQVVLLE